MAYSGPPQYGQAQNYPTAPDLEAVKSGPVQDCPAAPSPPYGYGKPAVHLAVSGAFDRYPPASSKPGASAAYDKGYSPGYGYGQSAGYVTVPGSFERHTEPAGVYTQHQRAQPSQVPLVDFSHHPDRETATDMPVFSSSSFFSDKAIRRGFIRKVYLILTTQLLVTLGFIAVFIFVQPVKDWVRTDGLWCYITAYVTFLVTYFVLVCCPSVRRNSPGNYICLFIFTVSFSYLAATISSFHDTKIVLLAAGITGAVCLAISLFAIQTKIDFTLCSGLLFALLMVLFFFGIACAITYSVWGYNHIMDTVYAGLGALVFALFLVYDTQMIVGGRKHEVSPEEYIYGALQLYLDVVYIFIFLLSLMGKKN